MTDQELDDVYTETCRKLGEVGPERAELYLARLALLLMLELDDPAAICRAIGAARANL
jgi:hypothetical protein